MVEKVLPQKIKLEIPEDVQRKITKLCSLINTVEWSGILLYTTKEPDMSIKDPENLVFVVKDIIPMDKGDLASTGFDTVEVKRNTNLVEDPHMDYCEEYPEAIRWTLGLIHSHHNMDVFFSGVDMAELRDNSPDHRYYLSLIVNNANEMIAKVAIASKVNQEISVPFKGLDNDGKEYTISEMSMIVKPEYLFIYDCEIIKPETVSIEDDFFTKRLTSILNKKKTSFPTTTNLTLGTTRSFSFPNIDEDDMLGHWKREMDKEIDEDSDTASEAVIEEFILDYLFAAFGSKNFSKISSFISYLSRQVLPPNFVSSVTHNYVGKFKSYFPEDSSDNIFFEEFKKEVIEVLEKYSKEYVFLKPIISSLHKVKLYTSRKNGRANR